MANSATWTKDSVFGDLRVRIGTLALADGSGGLAVPTGLNYVYYMGLTSSQMARSTVNCSANGSVNVCTALSGASFTVIVLGQ